MLTNCQKVFFIAYLCAMFYRELSRSEFADLSSRILYEDNHLLVVNKRAGEIIQGDKTGDECIADAFKAFIAQRDGKPGQVFLGIPHRLDRPVAGICVLAKTSKALGRLGEMFRNSEVSKIYWALCCSRPEPPEGYLENWLTRNESRNKSYVSAEGRGAKLARLKYRLVGSTKRYYLVEVELLTGRHHQIRCQLGNIGCPIKGDLKYGAPRSNPDGSISLLAREIRFVHPVKREPLDIIAPLPESWPPLD